jgi:hypothetical protein
VPLQGFVQQVVVPVLPALQQHLALALSVIQQPPQGDRDVLFDGEGSAGLGLCGNSAEGWCRSGIPQAW